MASVPLLRAQIEARLQNRIPAALTPAPCREMSTLASGIAGIEIPLSGLTEICARNAVSSGRTALLNSVMARVTCEQHCCALVDASDNFDPASAAAAGVDLERLLWVRCGPGKSAKKPKGIRTELQPLEQAFHAADMILQAGGFLLITVDLGGIDEKLLQKIPLTTWFRFARAVERMPAALIFLTSSPMARSCAALTLRVSMRRPQWRSTVSEISLPHATLLAGLDIEAEVLRARNPGSPGRDAFPRTGVGKPAQSSTSLFSVRAFSSSIFRTA